MNRLLDFKKTDVIGSLVIFDEVAVPRCFSKDVSSSTLENAEAHLFVDASEIACAVVLYFRFVDNGRPRCAPVVAKNEGCATKTSILRLEAVQESLNIQISERYL